MFCRDERTESVRVVYAPLKEICCAAHNSQQLTTHNSQLTTHNSQQQQQQQHQQQTLATTTTTPPTPRLRQVGDPFSRVLQIFMAEFSCRPRQVDGDGAAKRRRLRRLRSWWRHEQQTVAAVLATETHHWALRAAFYGTWRQPPGPGTGRSTRRTVRLSSGRLLPKGAGQHLCLSCWLAGTLGAARHGRSRLHLPFRADSRSSCAAGGGTGRGSGLVLSQFRACGCRAGYRSAQACSSCWCCSSRGSA